MWTCNEYSLNYQVPTVPFLRMPYTCRIHAVFMPYSCHIHAVEDVPDYTRFTKCTTPYDARIFSEPAPLWAIWSFGSFPPSVFVEFARCRFQPKRGGWLDGDFRRASPMTHPPSREPGLCIHPWELPPTLWLVRAAGGSHINLLSSRRSLFLTSMSRSEESVLVDLVGGKAFWWKMRRLKE